MSCPFNMPFILMRRLCSSERVGSIYLLVLSGTTASTCRDIFGSSQSMLLMLMISTRVAKFFQKLSQESQSPKVLLEPSKDLRDYRSNTPISSSRLSTQKPSRFATSNACNNAPKPHPYTLAVSRTTHTHHMSHVSQTRSRRHRISRSLNGATERPR